jgi:hypothetical protein
VQILFSDDAREYIENQLDDDNWTDLLNVAANCDMADVIGFLFYQHTGGDDIYGLDILLDIDLTTANDVIRAWAVQKREELLYRQQCCTCIRIMKSAFTFPLFYTSHQPHT